MPVPAYDAVLFDLAGTLFSQRGLRDQFIDVLANVARRAGVDETDRSRLRAAYLSGLKAGFDSVANRAYYHHNELFSLTFGGFLTELGATHDDAMLQEAIALQLEVTLTDLRLRPGTAEALTAMRSAGIHVGVVSNIDDDYFVPMVAKLGLADLADHLLSSEAAGSCKPDGAIFRQALVAAGCPAERALFVGDTPNADVLGANRAGLTSVLIVERDRKPPEPRSAGMAPDHVINDIPDLLPLLGLAEEGAA